MDFTQKNIHLAVISGVNRGFGWHIADELFKRLTTQSEQHPDEHYIIMGTTRKPNLAQQNCTTLPACQTGCAVTRVYLNVDFAADERLQMDAEIARGLQQISGEAPPPLKLASLWIIHNAGNIGDLKFPGGQSSFDLDFERVDSQLRANVSAMLVFNSALLSQICRTFSLAEACSVRVVQISTLCAIKPMAGLSFYCISKAARDMAMSCMQADWQNQQLVLEEKSRNSECDLNPLDKNRLILSKNLMTVNYAPGPMETDMWKELKRDCQDVSNQEMRQTLKMVDAAASAKLLIEKILFSAPSPQTWLKGQHVDYYDLA